MALERSKVWAALGLAIFICTPEKLSAYGDWTRFGPPSAVTLFLYFHPTQADVIFHYSDASTLSKSVDRGVSWKKINHFVEKDSGVFKQFYRGEHNFAVDPRPGYGGICYYMPSQPYHAPPIYRSADLGETWSALPASKGIQNGVLNVDYNGSIYALVPEGDSYRSDDSGQTWKRQTDHPFTFPESKYHSIDLEISKGNRLFGCDRLRGKGLFSSRNGGATWVQRLAGHWLVDVVCSPVDENLILVIGQDGKILRSEDAGESFQVVKHLDSGNYWSEQTWPPHRGGIAINSRGTVIAITRNEMAKSIDGGRTFVVTPEKRVKYKASQYWPYPGRRDSSNLLKCCEIRASPVDPDLWMFGDGTMNKRSIDGGSSWEGGFNDGTHGLWSYGPVMYDPDDPNVIHVCTVDFGHSFSTDRGKTWRSTETDRNSCDGIGFDPHNPDLWYKIRKIGHRGSLIILKNTQRGRTKKWDQVGRIESGNVAGYMGAIVVDPSDPTGRTIYVSDRSLPGIYKSTNQGRTFSMVREHPDIVKMVVTRKGNVYAHSFTRGKGLSRYLNETDSWRDIAPGRYVNGMAVHPKDEGVVYINADLQPGGGGKGNLLKTSNALSDDPSWQILTQHNGWALYIDPYRPKVMLSACVNLRMKNGAFAGIMRSGDGGATWRPLSSISPYNFIWGFQSGGPAARGRVYSYNATGAFIENIYQPDFQPE